jgi:hypothetical protein
VRTLLIAGIAATLFACAAGVARADVAVTAPIESVAGAIATTIADRPVSVRCETDDAWAALAAAGGFGPSQILGFVSFSDGAPLDYAELSPGVCRSLAGFASAPTKPTKCVQTQRRIRTTVRTVRGKKIRTTTYATAARPAAPCFTDGYFATAEALQTLAHESIHLKGAPVEAEAECFGMQWLAYAAQQLGASADEARPIAQYYATQVYPQRQAQSPAYWSADCRQNGPLDLTPDDGVWP